MKVLIVEDDLVTRTILGRLLSDRGYEVTAYAGGAEAMESCNAVFYPLVFLDLFMPGMDGFSFCRWLRHQPEGDRHVILIGTESGRNGDLQRILEAGADDYIVKPYQPDVLDVRLTIAHQRMKNIDVRKRLEASLLCERERLSYLATHEGRLVHGR